ncbi:MAG: orotate phosphoribosyltransferase [Bacteroidota bacterium]
MTNEEILTIFKKAGALLEGHFQLTSGLHSPHYFQCAKVLQHPRNTELLCGEIAKRFKNARIGVVVAPALGGIVVGQEVGRQLGVRTIFTERKEGQMQLRRGFEIARDERVLVCEDVVTTGGSVFEVMAIVNEHGGVVAGVGYVVDRSAGNVRFEMGKDGLQFALLHMDVVAYTPAECPLCASGIPVAKPGSRGNA